MQESGLAGTNLLRVSARYPEEEDVSAESGELDPSFASCTVSELMVTIPKTLPLETSLARVHDAFDDPHVHMVLLVRDGFLRGTLLRSDVSSAPRSTAVALPLATLTARTIGPDDRAISAHRTLVRTGQRRLAVVDPDNHLLGLLCLKRDRTGFCSDQGVAARASVKEQGDR